MKRFLQYIGLALVALVLAACGQSTSDTQTIKVATSPGPYSILFMEEVAPRLEEQGYTVEEIQFSELRQAMIAVDEGEADINVDGNRLNTESYNDTLGASFQQIVRIPTVPAAIYPGQKDSLDAVEAGDTIAIGNGTVSMMRGLLLMQDLGWITLNPDVEPAKVTADDIEENHVGIEIVEMQGAAIPPAIQDVSYALVAGSIAYDAGMDLDSRLITEQPIEGLLLEAITTADKMDQPWVEDIKAIYQSEDFNQAVLDRNEEIGTEFWIIPEENK
ncbi:MetQ/NlpA family ABC transporter substrate-binding protein [Aerococcus viridans]|uniref:MetQ/NlpA family ABC transporter substrate-binding protein n=1 Tax=Aerococcus viridans TaxID=1377 RepID=UPI0002FAD0BC|nr:MetQ/NlpA family ABC transporter substrate-binding protein [Aerococcus viridans]